jgi:hypothetical protein
MMAKWELLHRKPWASSAIQLKKYFGVLVCVRA